MGIRDVAIGPVIHVTTAHLDQRDFWMTWIVHRATIGSTDFIFGEDVTEAQFIDIADIVSSDHAIEKLIVETFHATRAS